MNPLDDYKDKLKHIIDEINYLITTSAELSYNNFITNESLKRAFVRSLEIIGEAIKLIPLEIKKQKGQIEWRKIAGMRA